MPVPCSSCGSRKTKHQVKFKNGTVRTYDDEKTARAIAKTRDGAEYQNVKT